MKNTNHLDPLMLYRQMVEDHKEHVATKLADMHMSTEGSETGSYTEESNYILTQ